MRTADVSPMFFLFPLWDYVLKQYVFGPELLGQNLFGFESSVFVLLFCTSDHLLPVWTDAFKPTSLWSAPCDTELLHASSLSIFFFFFSLCLFMSKMMGFGLGSYQAFSKPEHWPVLLLIGPLLLCRAHEELLYCESLIKAWKKQRAERKLNFFFLRWIEI